MLLHRGSKWSSHVEGGGWWDLVAVGVVGVNLCTFLIDCLAEN